MKKYLFGPALAALAMFAFGALYWMSPFPYKVLKNTADDSAAGLALARIFPETGTYLVPGMSLDQRQTAELYRRGPSAEVQFSREGHDAMEPAVYVKGYAHYFVVSVLLAALLRICRNSLPTYSGRVRFCVLVAAVGSALIAYSDPIWWHRPWAWHIVSSVYFILVLCVCGFVLAAFIKPEPRSSSPVRP
jgi:hypothetical protein